MNMKQKKGVPAEKSGYRNQENRKWGQERKSENRPKQCVFKRSKNIGTPEEYVGDESRDYPRRKNESEEMNERKSEHGDEEWAETKRWAEMKVALRNNI